MIRPGARACIVPGVLLVAVTACGAPEPTPPQFPPPPDPLVVCAGQLEYWAGEQLRSAPDQGFDYQHMGLTSGQADALRSIVDDARMLVVGAQPAFVAERARTACAALTAGPSSAPWGTGPAT